METSLKLIVVVLLASSSSDSAPTGLETPAEVVETPQRILTVQPLTTFNNGKPFVAERDPMTGAFDLRTTPVNADDYIYEEFEDTGEGIDRKDEVSHTSNHIISIPAKDSELHKFLNLPVHYSTASKYPLISSSYANTKIQGHGASNHRPATSTSTPSTVPPSYYPHKTAATTSTTTTPRPSTSRPSSTTEAVRTTAKTVASSASPPPAYEYEYEYDYGDQPNKASSEPPKSDFDFMSFFNFGSSETSTTLRTTAKTTNRPSPPSPLSTTRTTTTHRPPAQSTQGSSTSQPSTTSQHPKVENEPKPSTFGNEDTKTSTPGTKAGTMIAIKSESIPSKNKTESTEKLDQSEDDDVSSEVIGLKPPVKFPDSIMKPPPKYGDRIEPPRIEDSGWKGRPDITPGLQSAKIPAKPSTTTYAPPHSNSHVRPFEPKPEGTNQVKYSVNRPHEYSAKKPIEFHQHLVTKFNPTVEEDGKGDHKPEITKPAKEEVSPQVVVAMSSTPQASTELLPTAIVEPEKSPVPSRPVEPPSRPPSLTFAESETSSRPQGYGTGQVYHATINDDKPVRLPASTYLQRPPVYAQPSQPQKDKGQNPTAPEQDESAVFNKVSYRPQPGLIMSYQPHQHQGPHQGQIQQLAHKPQQGMSPQQGVPQPSRPQPNFNQQVSAQQGFPQQVPPQQNFPHQGQPPQGLHQAHGQGFPQQGSPQQGLQFHQLPQFHRVPQPFSPPPQQGGNTPSQDEKRPAVWPPKGKPQDSQNVQQFAFFPQTEQKPTGIGSVEPVRTPPRLPNKGSVAVSSVSGDTQSYSLQTSFAIGMPAGHGEGSKVTAGTVSAVPLHQAVASVSGPLPPQSPPQQSQPVASNTIKYPPPPWEANLNKPFKDPVKRKPLPNILPQFRPNAKVGTVEPSGPHMMGVSYMREPIDRLQPPPLPPPLPPQPRPVHRSDDHPPHPHQHHQHFPPVRPVAAYLRSETPAPPSIVPPQPVHRRNGIGTKVATLQMMQSPPPVTRKAEEPVMVVYPSNIDEASTVKNWRLFTPDFTTDDDFPHDVDDARTKDTPILKEKPSPPKQPLKVEFPYPLEKPLPDGEIKEYQAYSPTSPEPEKQAGSSPTEAVLTGHRLQDYHPSMGVSSSTGSPKRVPPVGQFGWSVIGTRSDDDLTTTTDSGSTSGPMAPPQLSGGFRPIPAPSLE